MLKLCIAFFIFYLLACKPSGTQPKNVSQDNSVNQNKIIQSGDKQPDSRNIDRIEELYLFTQDNDFDLIDSKDLELVIELVRRNQLIEEENQSASLALTGPLFSKFGPPKKITPTVGPRPPRQVDLGPPKTDLATARSKNMIFEIRPREIVVSESLIKEGANGKLTVKTVSNLEQIDSSTGSSRLIAYKQDEPVFKKFSDVNEFTYNNVVYTKTLLGDDYVLLKVKPIEIPKNLVSIKDDIDSGSLIKTSSYASQSPVSKLNSNAMAAFHHQKIDIVEGGKGTIEIDSEKLNYSITSPFKGKGSGASIYAVEISSAANPALKSDFVVKQLKKKKIEGSEFDSNLKQLEEIQNAALYREIEMLDNMSFHPNSLEFHGAFYKGDTYFVGMEKAARGDIRGVLDDIESGKDVPIAERNLLIFSSAESLASLHSVGRYHGDVKSDNFFIHNKGQAKLADYGESITASKKDDMQRFAAMAYKIRTGSKEASPDNLLNILAQKSPKSDFDDLLEETIKKADDPNFQMRDVVNRLMLY